MKFKFTQEQQALQDMVRKMISKERLALESLEDPETWDQAIWANMAQLGLLGVHIPEKFGGMGYSEVELSIVAEETGRALCHVPFLSTIGLSTSALNRFGSEHQKQRFLRLIAAGETRFSFCISENPPDHSNPVFESGAMQTSFRETAEGYILNGQKTSVIDGHGADYFIVVATDDTREENAYGLFIIPKNTDGLQVRRLHSLDVTRSLSELNLSNVCVPLDMVMPGADGHSHFFNWSSIESIIDLGRVALCAENVGAAEACLEMAVEYAKMRHQFGRPIGSFQAVKHLCANMLVKVESARSAAYYAAWVASQDGESLSEAVSLALSYCSESFFDCAGDNIQIHGGIGFTWEHDAHHYFKRAAISKSILGTSAFSRRRYAGCVGLYS